MTVTEQRARTFLGVLARHEWALAEAEFDPAMAELLPVGKLESFWTGVESRAGSWVGIDTVVLEKKGAVDVAEVTCRFARLRKMARVSFDSSGRVAGLFVRPVPDDLQASARELIAAMARKDFLAASKEFDDTMRSALPPEKLAEAWKKAEDQFGAFVAVERVRVEHQHGYWIAFARCGFSREEGLVKVVFDGKNQVAGLFILDVAADAQWSPPPYANPAAFVERNVQVGTHPSLPGTLSLPAGGGPFPAVVLVHGSGPQDADETVGAIKVFKDLAFGLATRGIAVLRYAKRTQVDPRGVSTVQEEVLDGARAAVDALMVTPEIDATRIVVLGHSLGGYLAPWIARDDKRVAGLIVMAGCTRPLQDLVVDQVRYLASLTPNAMPAGLEQARQFKAAVEDPALTPDRVMPNLAGGVTGAYYLALRGYHPELVAAGLGRPMLIAWGQRDYQVGEADFRGWKHALSALSQVTFREYPSLDHLFVSGTGPSTPAQYDRPGHVDAAFIDDIVNWVHVLPYRAEVTQQQPPGVR
jgi:dienelactone hydrolase